MTGTDGHTEDALETTPMFSERLWPSVGVSLFWLLMTVSLGIAYGKAYGLGIGVTIGASASLVVALGLILTAPIVQVDDLILRAGKAQLPRKFIGKVTRLNRQETRDSFRNRAHHQAFFLMKFWISESVIVENTDQDDPHPYWHVSSRHAKALSDALNGATIVKEVPDGSQES